MMNAEVMMQKDERSMLIVERNGTSVPLLVHRS
jgi:hypothetical protein